jgi:hypothetical protein
MYYFSGVVSWLENRGGATFSSMFDGSEHVIATGHIGATIIAAADADGDGELARVVTTTAVEATADALALLCCYAGFVDVAVAAFSIDEVAWFRNTGAAGALAFVLDEAHVVSSTLDGAANVLWTDLNADGLVDLAFCGGNANEVYWSPNAGGANNSARFGSSFLVSSSATYCTGLDAGDVDGDGDVDLVYSATADNRIDVVFNDGGTDDERRFDSTPVVVADELLYVTFIRLVDVDADGDVDIVASVYEAHLLAWFENVGVGESSSAFSSSGNFLKIRSPDGFDVVDIDGDGDEDFVAGSRSDALVMFRSRMVTHSVSASGSDAHCLTRDGTPCATVGRAITALSSHEHVFSLSRVVVRGRVPLDHVLLGSAAMQRPVVIEGAGDDAVLVCVDANHDGVSDVAADVLGTAAIRVCGARTLTIRNVALEGCSVRLLQAHSAHVVLRNVTVRSVWCDGGGCVVDARYSNVLLERVRVYNVSGGGDGGVVRAVDTTVALLQSTFDDVSVTGDSRGAVVNLATEVTCTAAWGSDCTRFMPRLHIHASVVRGCSSGGNGGAVYADSSSVHVMRARMQGCASRGDGGAVAVAGASKLMLLDCDFEGNSAVRGGAVAALAIVSTTVRSSRFVNNSADVGGSLALCDVQRSRLFDVETSGSVAARDGGFLYVGPLQWTVGAAPSAGPRVTVLDAVVATDCSADGGSGGGVLWSPSDGDSLDVNSSVVVGRADRGGGGAVFVRSTPDTVAALTVSSDTTFDGSAAAFGATVATSARSLSLVCVDGSLLTSNVSDCVPGVTSASLAAVVTAVVDEYGQRMLALHDGLCQLALNDSTVAMRGAEASVDSGAVRFESLDVRGTIGSWYDATVSCTFSEGFTLALPAPLRFEMILCAAGSEPAADRVGCVPCSAGTHNTDGVRCLPCPAGYYSSVQEGASAGVGATTCVGCPRNTFSAATGIASAASCLSCSIVGPHRMTLGVGASSREGCVCSVGFIDVDGSCEACLRGENCTSDGVTVDTLPLLPGFWRTSARSRDVRQCRLQGVCLGGALAVSASADSDALHLSADVTCREHHYGPLCEVRCCGAQVGLCRVMRCAKCVRTASTPASSAPENAVRVVQHVVAAAGDVSDDGGGSRNADDVDDDDYGCGCCGAASALTTAVPPRLRARPRRVWAVRVERAHRADNARSRRAGALGCRSSSRSLQCRCGGGAVWCPPAQDLPGLAVQRVLAAFTRRGSHKVHSAQRHAEAHQVGRYDDAHRAQRGAARPHHHHRVVPAGVSVCCGRAHARPDDPADPWMRVPVVCRSCPSSCRSTA